MADLTLAQRFGSNTSFDETTKVLSINLNDLSNIIVNGADLGLDTSQMTDANKDEYASKILWALVTLSAANQPETNNDETVGVYITNEGKRNAIRNSIAQFGYRQVVTAYRNDDLGTQLDPDAIA